MPGFPIAPDSLPVVGDELEIEAFSSDISPKHLVVVNATVNGIELTTDNWNYHPGWNDGHRDRRRYSDGRTATIPGMAGADIVMTTIIIGRGILF